MQRQTVIPTPFWSHDQIFPARRVTVITTIFLEVITDNAARAPLWN